MSQTIDQNRITCGEYLNDQRRELAGITDLSAHGALDKVEDCLCNIYAVSYQMHFERIEPPSKHRGPAEHEPLDRHLVDEMSSGLKNKAHVFQDIMKDPWKLGQAMVTAQKGNGFPLIEMVNAAFIAKQAKTAVQGSGVQKQAAVQSSGMQMKDSASEHKPENKPAGPVL